MDLSECSLYKKRGYARIETVKKVDNRYSEGIRFPDLKYSTMNEHRCSSRTLTRFIDATCKEESGYSSGQQLTNEYGHNEKGKMCSPFIGGE
jgi:hypothetical protein